MTSRHRSLWCVLSLALAACGADDPLRGTPGDDEDWADGGPRGGDVRDGGPEQREVRCEDGRDDDGDGAVDCRDSDCPCFGEGDFVPCEGVHVEARQRARPVDVVWVIDDSPSMVGEAAIVQRNMNSFAERVGASAIDFHVIVVTKKELVRVPAPLGADPEHFLAVDRLVLSHNAFDVALGSLSAYRGFLRDEASTHFVFVTDDESDLGWEEFRSRMEAELGHGLSAHAIVSPPGSRHGVFDDGCTGPNGDAMANGDEYWALAEATGGQRHSICTDDWSAVFDALSVEMAERVPVPCELELPDPPEGMVFDPALVNVVYVRGDASETARQAGTAADCTPGELLWRYDDPAAPTAIVLCPDLCAALTGDETAGLDVELGCATLLI